MKFFNFLNNQPSNHPLIENFIFLNLPLWESLLVKIWNSGK